MNKQSLYDQLEEKIQLLQAGQPLDSVLEDGDPQTEELRPLLETALLASNLPGAVGIPVKAQNRSRASFLTAAGQARAQQGPALPHWFPRLRLSSAVLILAVALLFAGLLGSGLVSAQSIPGDTLYPVKLAVEQARLSLVPDGASRLNLEERFDQERVEESKQVLALRRGSTVSITGYLQAEDKNTGLNQWELSGLPLILTSQQNASIRGLEGVYVEVDGQPTSGKILVNTIRARLFDVSGVIQEQSASRWRVGDVNLRLTPQTVIRVQPRIGLRVYVSAIRYENQDLVALLISPMSGAVITYQPTDPTSTESENDVITPLPGLSPSLSPNNLDSGSESTNESEYFPSTVQQPETSRSAESSSGSQESTKPVEKESQDEPQISKDTQKTEGSDH